MVVVGGVARTTRPPPLAFVVARASATNRAAPRAELAPPFRSRVAAISGADVGVDSVAINAVKPLTPV
jgi:hypothetical protein